MMILAINNSGPRSAANSVGVAQPNGRVRPDGEREGDHGNEPLGHARSGAFASWTSRPKDRVSVARSTSKATHLLDHHE